MDGAPKSAFRGIPGAVLLLWAVLAAVNYAATARDFVDPVLLLASLKSACLPGAAPFLGDRLRELLWCSVLVAAFDLSALGVGTQLAMFVGKGRKGGGPVALFIGFGAVALAVLGLGLAGLWFRFPLAVTGFGGILVFPRIAARGAAALASALRDIPAGIRARPWLLAIVPALLTSLAGALAPETSFDPLRCYQYLPKVFAAGHRVSFIPHYGFSAYPLAAPMLFGVLRGPGGEAAAKLFNWHLLVLLAPLACGLAGTVGAGVAAWAAMLCVPVVLMFAANGFADLLTTGLVAAALVYAIRDGRAAGSAVTSGILLGFALGSKYPAVQAILPLALVWALAGGWRVAGLAMAAALAAWSPWLVRDWLATGNPIHPLFAAWLGSVDAPVSFLAAPSLAPGIGESGPSILNPWRWFVMRESPGWFFLGPLPLALAPLAAAGGTPRARQLGIFALVYSVCWAASTLLLRGYLVPAFPAWLCAAVLAFGALTHRGRIALAEGAAGLVGQAMGVYLIFTAQFPLPYVGGCESRAGFLAGRMPVNFPAMSLVDAALSPGEAFYSYGEMVTYYSVHRGFTDYEFENPLLRRLAAGSRTPADMRKGFRQGGVAALLHNANGGVTQGIVAEMPSWTARDLSILQEFVRFYAEPVSVAGGPRAEIVLYRLHGAPSPRGRLRVSRKWLHLPSAENILAPADRAWDAGDKRGALTMLKEVTKGFPDYAYAWQRVADIERELGHTGASRKAEERFRRLAR